MQTWVDRPNFWWRKINSFNPPPTTNQQPPKKNLEEILTQYTIEAISKNHEEARRNNETSIKNLEMQIGRISTQLADMTRVGFSRTNLDNPKGESCRMVVKEEEHDGNDSRESEYASEVESSSEEEGEVRTKEAHLQN